MKVPAGPNWSEPVLDLGEGNLKRALFLAGLLCLLLSFIQAQAETTTNSGGTTTVPATQPLDETKVLLDEGLPVQPGTAATSVGALGFWDFVRMILVLALVVVAIYGFYFLLRRNKKQDQGDSDIIKLLASRTLPGNRAVHLLEVGKHVFLVGNAEQSVNLLAEITDQESIDDIRIKAAAEQNTAPRTFAEMIGGVFTPPGNADSAQGGQGTTVQSPLDFLKQKNKRLKDMGDKK